MEDAATVDSLQQRVRHHQGDDRAGRSSADSVDPHVDSMVIPDAFEPRQQRRARPGLIGAERRSSRQRQADPQRAPPWRHLPGGARLESPDAPLVDSRTIETAAHGDIPGGERQAKRLQAVIDSSPLALVEFGLDTRIRLWNPAAERIFGWTRDEILGRDGLPMAPPSRRAST